MVINKFWISSNCLQVDNIGAMEYTMILGETLCSVRVKDGKVLELYFFDRTPQNQILAVTEHDFNKYTQVNGIITRDDGAIYEYTETRMIRKGDKRTYTCAKCNPEALPTIVYTAYHFMRHDRSLRDYNALHDYDINRLCVAALQQLIKKINTYDKIDKADLVRNNLILWEY